MYQIHVHNHKFTMTTHLTMEQALYLVQTFYQPNYVHWTRSKKRYYARRLIAKCEKILRTPRLLREVAAYVRESVAKTKVILQDPMGFWSVHQVGEGSPQLGASSLVGKIIEIDLWD